MMNRLFVCFVSLIVILAAPARAEVSWFKISDGSVDIAFVERSDGLPGVRAAFAVTGSRQKVWDALQDFSRFSEFFPRVTRVKVHEERDDGDVIELWIDAFITEINYVQDRRNEVVGERITWTRVSGDLERVEGGWTILNAPVNDKAIVIYETFVDIGFIPPSWLRGVVEDEARSMGRRLQRIFAAEAR